MIRLKTYKKFFFNIVSALVLTMFFSCTNSSQEVKDFFADKNLPIGFSENVYHVYKDSGRISSKMRAPLLLDFSNRKLNPYTEFPKGIEILSFKNKGLDSILIQGDYAITYDQSSLSKVTGNVVVINYHDGSELQTEELYWDDSSNYFFTECEFTLTEGDKVIYGKGFESKQDLSKYIMRRIYGNGLLSE